MFFGLRGSIAGVMRRPRVGASARRGTKLSMVNTRASYSARNGNMNSRTASFGSDVSMWQRQIHLAPAGSRKWRMAAV